MSTIKENGKALFVMLAGKLTSEVNGNKSRKQGVITETGAVECRNTLVGDCNKYNDTDVTGNIEKRSGTE